MRFVKTTVSAELVAISRVRGELLGLAALMIAWFHSGFLIRYPSVDAVNTFMYTGVDIFMFLSGLGAARSLSRRSPQDFYKRRFLRLFPAYLPVVTLWFLYAVCPRFVNINAENAPVYLTQYLGNIFMTGELLSLPGQLNWYIQAIVWFYLASPLLLPAARKATESILSAVLLFSGLLLFLCTFSGHIMQMAISRLPLYVIGMMAQLLADREKPVAISPICAWLVAAAALAVPLWFFVNDEESLTTLCLWWLPFALVTPGACMLLSRAFTAMQKNSVSRGFCALLRLLGKNSFELYIIGTPAFQIVKNRLPDLSDPLWLAVMIVVILGACVYGTIMRAIVNAFTQRKTA